MTKYRNNCAAVRELVRETEVHKDIYIDEEVFSLEMEHLFANTWIYVGHASQVPKLGDFYSTTVGDQPVVMVRHSDNTVRVLMNRCAHKGVQVAPDGYGNTGKFFRCPYHAWTYKTDGSILSIPLKKGYENTGLEECEASKGMVAVGALKDYREFIFCRLAKTGISFEDYFGDSLSTLDNMVERSPEGKLEVAGGVMRYLHHCNWKMLVDNQTDPLLELQSRFGSLRRQAHLNRWRLSYLPLSSTLMSFSKKWVSVFGSMVMAIREYPIQSMPLIRPSLVMVKA